MKKTGVVEWFFETGCEGMVWVFYEDGKKDWDAYNNIEKDDHLTIYNPDGSIAFDGKIVPDYKAGWKPYPKNRKYGQPCALGFWIHWTQKGWHPDDWARLFIRKKGESPLRAELIKKQKIKRPKS